MDHRRRIPVTVDQLREIQDGIDAYIRPNDAFAPGTDVSTFVRVDSFADSSINILVYCFTKTTKWGEWLEIKEALACRIKEIVKGAGAGFAFPSRSVYLETIPLEAPEISNPPSVKLA
ncbi:MAG: mechanosensitive ion channel family protein [Rhodospirillaceae bacterium]